MMYLSMNDFDDSFEKQPRLFSVDPKIWTALLLEEAYPDITPDSYLARLAMTNHEELQECIRHNLPPESHKYKRVVDFGRAFDRMYKVVTSRCAQGMSYQEAVREAAESMRIDLALTTISGQAQGELLFQKGDDITTLVSCYEAEEDIHGPNFASQ